jgi:hypothetical protein
MILYEVTVQVDSGAEEEWITYMTRTHIPAVMRTEHFDAYQMVRVVDPVPLDSAQVTYRITYQCGSTDALERYLRESAPALQADHTQRFGGRVSASRAVYEQIYVEGLA